MISYDISGFYFSADEKTLLIAGIYARELYGTHVCGLVRTHLMAEMEKAIPMAEEIINASVSAGFRIREENGVLYCELPGTK